MSQKPKWSQPVTPNSITSMEEAQACFADVYDGDYAMMDLLYRDGLSHAVLFLYGVMVDRSSPLATGQAIFRNADGDVTQVSRTRKERELTSKWNLPIDQLVVIVRNGRVEGITG